MSYIGHRCTRCGTSEQGHEYVFDHHLAKNLKPELIQTYDGFGAPVSTIEQPGECSFIYGHRTITPCGCASCVALYNSLRVSA